MKDYTKKQYSESRPTLDAPDCINYCLHHLFADKKHVRGDEIVKNLTFEELIGALLSAKDVLDKQEK
jgi:hypothetical protein